MTIPTEVYATTRAAPVGKCIYCNQTEDLTDEHVVPFALGGRLVLPDASCKKCAKITSAFEAKVLRGFMLEARAVGKFPTRRPKERPTTIPLTIGTGEHAQLIELGLADAPGFLHLPLLTPAAYLAGQPAATGVNICGNQVLYFGKPPTDVAASLGTKTLTSTFTLDVIGLRADARQNRLQFGGRALWSVFAGRSSSVATNIGYC